MWILLRFCFSCPLCYVITIIKIYVIPQGYKVHEWSIFKGISVFKFKCHRYLRSMFLLLVLHSCFYLLIFSNVFIHVCIMKTGVRGQSLRHLWRYSREKKQNTLDIKQIAAPSGQEGTTKIHVQNPINRTGQWYIWVCVDIPEVLLRFLKKFFFVCVCFCF